MAEPAAPGLIDRLRRHAECYAAADKMMADAKTARQADRDDYPDVDLGGYSSIAAEETDFWKAAEALVAMRSVITASAETFRNYERQHRQKVVAFAAETLPAGAERADAVDAQCRKIADTQAKAERNREMAELCEAAVNGL